jgi:hypothetical protein
MVIKKAANSFHSNLLDVEVQVIPNNCTAVQAYQK